MSKHYTPPDDGSGWTEWQFPTQKYRMSCCDCGLVHDMEFAVMTDLKPDKRGYLKGRELPYGKSRAAFRVARNNMATAAMRRHMNGGKHGS